MRRIAAVLAGSMMALSLAQADELGRWCDVASENVVDCPCATEFLSQHLSLDEANLLMQLWAAATFNAGRPSAAALAEQHGSALVRAVMAFDKKRDAFLMACPRTKLSMEYEVDVEQEAIGSVRRR